jgi:Uma2 family endonuclease
MSTNPSAFDALYADLLALPENRVGEIIDGVLYSMPRPALPHAVVTSALGAQVRSRFNGSAGGPPEQPGGWVIIDEPELRIASNVLVPDIAGWRRERLPEMPQTAFVELPPDWVCEVTSLSTGAYDRKRKLPCYAAMGVPHVWLIDPATRCIEVFALTHLPEIGNCYALLAVHGEDEASAIQPFDAVELDVAALWRW